MEPVIHKHEYPIMPIPMIANDAAEKRRTLVSVLCFFSIVFDMFEIIKVNRVIIVAFRKRQSQIEFEKINQRDDVAAILPFIVLVRYEVKSQNDGCSLMVFKKNASSPSEYFIKQQAKKPTAKTAAIRSGLITLFSFEFFITLTPFLFIFPRKVLQALPLSAFLL